MIKTAILVDAAFYLKRASALFGKKSAEDRADELVKYCQRHLRKGSEYEECELYRIFIYDCPPSEKSVYHPLLQKQVFLKNTDSYKWSVDFHSAVITKRKVALRLGELLESSAGYCIRPDVMKKLCLGNISISDLKETDFYLDIKQKGVDMRIGLDISSLSFKHLVDRIVLIAGDSDFVPAAKHARREGIDFILDPMWHTIKPSLNEHIDGLRSCVAKPPANSGDPLYSSAEV